MRALTTAQAAMVARASKNVTWCFFIYDKNGVGYSHVSGLVYGAEWDTVSWATGTEWDSGDAMSSVIITDFSGIELRRSSPESNIIAPSELTFSISNPNNTYVFSDFTGGTVFLQLVVSDGVDDMLPATWKFNIKKAEPGYQKIKITAEDFLQKYLRGDYPNTRLPADIFPCNHSYENDGVCIPVPFGTAYVPLRSPYIDAATTYAAATLATVQTAAGVNCAITDSANGLGGFFPGMITVSGFTNPANNGTFNAVKVTAGQIDFTGDAATFDAGFVTEGAGDAVTLSQGDNFFMLGSTGVNYTITKIRNPSDLGYRAEFSSAGYTFEQYTKADADAVDWRVFRAIISDLDNNGTMDAPGFFGINGGVTYDAPVQFTRSDTATMTNPADVIAFVLKDMGIPAANIDEAVTFAAAHVIFDRYAVPLTFNGAFWYKQTREKVLAQLLNMCHATLRVTEKIELHVLSKASKKTITDKEVLRSSEQGEGSFTYRDILSENYSDCGYVTWQQSGEAQDRFLKIIVPAKTTSSVISGEVLECPFVQDSRNAQRIGTLYYYRKLLKDAEIGFLAPGTCLALQPDDVITINHPNYGGSYAVLIDSMRINKDLSIQFGCTHYSAAMDDWTDLAPTTVTVPTDDTAYAWQPTISGPQTDQDIGRAAFDTWGKEYLTIGPVANQGKFTDIQKALNAVKQAGGGAIYILNGNYAPPDQLYIPDVNLEVVGQSRGGVTITGKSDSSVFILHNLTKSIDFHDFTVTCGGITVPTSKHIFALDGTTKNDFTATVLLHNLTLNLGATIYSAPNEYGFLGCYANKISGILKMSDNAIDGGTLPLSVVVDIYAAVDFINNIVTDTHYGVQSIFTYAPVNLLNNRISGFVRSGMVLYYNAGDLQVAGNSISAADCDRSGGSHVGIYHVAHLTDHATKIINNDILILNSLSATDHYYGIDAEGNRTQITGNTIKIISSYNGGSSGEIAGIAGRAVNSNISDNGIYIDNVNAADHWGICLTSQHTDGAVSHNHINLVNNAANDYGIYVDGFRNQGSDNITENVGTALVADATNFITGLDDGVPF